MPEHSTIVIARRSDEIGADQQVFRFVDSDGPVDIVAVLVELHNRGYQRGNIEIFEEYEVETIKMKPRLY